MKIIKSEVTKSFILNFWERSNLEQAKSKDQETIIYSPFPVDFIVSKKLFFIDFLFHPILIKKRKYFEAADIFDNEPELLDKINRVLEYELTYELNEETSYLKEEERDKLIKFHKKLQNRLNKKHENV